MSRASGPSRLPARAHLPSGLVVVLDRAVARERTSGAAESHPVADSLAFLRAPGLLRSVDGATMDVDDLALRDFHALSAMLAHAGLVEEAPRERPCDNCGDALRVRASRAFEIAPFVDGELDDAELDAPFDFSARHPIPPIRTARGVARDVLLAPRTVGEASRLLEATGPLELDRSVVAALGIRALGGETRANELVRALTRADDRAWSAVLGLLEDAQYSPRMFSEIVCSGCGARALFPVPADRALDRLAPPETERFEVGGGPGFPSLDAFEQTTRRLVARVFERRALRNIDVVVDDGVAWVDDGGEPLLGCYTPGDPSIEPPTRPEIRLFYRTFAAEHRGDPAFEVDGEIEETLDHEAQHHLHHLDGDDPMDDEEREVIAKERERVVGRSELSRRAGRALFDEIAGFGKVAFPLIALLVLLSAFRYCSGSG